MKNSITSLLTIRLLLSCVFLSLLLACSGRNNSGIKILSVGESYLEVPGGKIWYKVTGEGRQVPLVLIHGGPGASSGYMKAFEELGNDRQIIRYDQLGCGKSDFITDTSLFNIDNFVNELDSLRRHLGIEVWNLFGHSWGTVIAVEYYKCYPDRVASIILGSLCIDVSAWLKSTNRLLLNLPDSLQRGIQTAEETGKYNDPLYQEAMEVFYSRYVWGENPPKAESDSIMSRFNTVLYNYMWGPSEFSATGTLKNYNATDLLPKIKVPVLFTVGEFDEILPEIVKEKADMVKDSRFVIFKGSTHMTPWDSREESIKVVREFLKYADNQYHK